MFSIVLTVTHTTCYGLWGGCETEHLQLTNECIILDVSVSCTRCSDGFEGACDPAMGSCYNCALPQLWMLLYYIPQLRGKHALTLQRSLFFYVVLPGASQTSTSPSWPPCPLHRSVQSSKPTWKTAHQMIYLFSLNICVMLPGTRFDVCKQHQQVMKVVPELAVE